MIEIRADGCLVKVVGYQHENNRAQIRFPLDDVRDMVYGSPGGTFALAYKRAFDDQFYTSTDFEVNDDYLIWTVGSHALAVRGDVEVQISYSTADSIAETQIFRFKVSQSIMDGTEGQGENLEDLIEQALTAAGGISAEIAAAEATLDAAVADAQAAQTAAETAQGAAETAQQEAETAKAGAEAAQEAAEGAQERAEAAEGNAAADAADAAQSASEAANSASAAALSASGAATSAAGAEADRITAQGAKLAAEAAQAGAEAAQAAAETAVAGVETAGATQVAAVNAAGTTQVGNVNTAGATQVAAVQAAGQAVIEDIPADYSELSADVTQVKNALNALESCETDGYRLAIFASGKYDANFELIPETTLIVTGIMSVKKGDQIIIRHGSYRWAVSLYAGTLDSYIRISPYGQSVPYYSVDDIINVYADGFFWVNFADPDNYMADISLDDFDGAVSVTSYAQTKADKKELKEFSEGFSVTSVNVLDESELVSTTKYWDKLSNSALTLSKGTATYYSYLVPVDGSSTYTFRYTTRYVFPVAADGVTALADALASVTSIDTSQYTGCKYIAISVITTYDMASYCVSKGSTATKGKEYTYPEWFSGKFNPLKDSVDGLSDELTSFEDGYEVYNLNILDDEGAEKTSETKYYGKSSSTGKLILSTATTATYTSFIAPVDGESIYTFKNTTRFVFAVAEDRQTVIGSGLNNVTSINTADYEGCKYIALSVNNTYDMTAYCVSKGNTAQKGTATILPGWFGNKVNEIEEQINSLDVKPKKNKVYMLTDTSFSEEKNFSGFATSVKSKILHLVVNPTSLTSVSVGFRNTTRVLFYAQVTSDSVVLWDYNNGATERTQTYTHGLTIENCVSIDVYAAPNTGLYYVRVASNGAEYVTPSAFNIAPTGLIYPYATMEGSANFVQFSVECNTNRPIWLFGDSYLGTYNTARWAYYLVNREQDSRVMMDAFAGESSPNAIASLNKLIDCGVPDYIVWCLGMNDGSDNGATPNTTWMGNIESLLAICEENNITPILATIPTVPSTNHEAKNAWVRESGYQYIDFAKAVGASDQGVWFEGMLSTDNVHPSVTGAITLYHAALAGCPQFSQM